MVKTMNNNLILINKKNKIKNNIISIAGINKELKLYFLISLIKKYNNILIINMDFFNNNFNEILYENNYKKNKNIYFLNGQKMAINNNNIEKYINCLKNKYELIIINASHECFLEYNKRLINLCEKNYFLIKNNFSEIKKSINILKIYNNIWKINNKKIKIIIKK